MSESLALERLLRRERTLTVAGLLVLCVLAWIYVLSGAGLGMSAWDMTTFSLFPHKAISAAARDVGGMDMAGMEMGGGMATGRLSSPIAWTPQIWLLTVAMWWTMMVAMMTPSAAPIILLYGRVRRTAAGRTDAATSGVFAAGYLLVWLGFSL
jgi:predicted metal-binding membrane protein